MSLRRALVGLMAVGCLLALIESVTAHRAVVRENLIAAAPTIVSALGFLVGSAAFLWWRPKVWRAVQGIALLLVLVGVVGLYFHNAGRLLGEREAEHEEHHVHNAGRLLGEREAEHEEHHAPPPLAPLVLTGMGILGFMATYPHWHPEGELEE